MNVLERAEKTVREIDPINAEHILNDHDFERHVGSAERFTNKGDERIVEMIFEDLEKFARTYNERNLTPENVKVGDGVTIHYYSDAHAATVIKVTKTTITVQRDTATLDPDWRPEIVPGGFAGHCTNQRSQSYTYERNENGEIKTFRWSKKYNRYKDGKTGLSLTKGRHEFYDYNF